MAQDPADFQSHAVIAGKVENHRAGRRTDGEYLEDAVMVGTIEAADLDALDLIEGNAGKGALVQLAPREGLAFPLEPVGDEDEAPLLREIGHLADRDEGILEDGRYDREILLVLGAQLQRVGHGPPVRNRRRAVRSRRRTRPASPRGARSRDRDDRSD